MMRRSAAALLVLAGLLAPAWRPGRASAGNGVGCTGSTCSVLLSTLITLKGDAGAGRRARPAAGRAAPLPVAADR